MTDDDLEESLQAFAAVLDHVVREAVCEDFAGERWDGYSCAFPFEDVSEVFEVGIASADDGVPELESWDVGARVDFIGGVH